MNMLVGVLSLGVSIIFKLMSSNATSLNQEDYVSVLSLLHRQTVGELLVSLQQNLPYNKSLKGP